MRCLLLPSKVGCSGHFDFYFGTGSKTAMKDIRVPVLEDAFEINLAKLMAVWSSTGQSLLAVGDGATTGLIMLCPDRLTAFLDGATYRVDIVAIPCLKGRVRPLLKCPRAHEGNFQSLYWSGSEVACRHCLGLRYRSSVAATATDRARFARHKLLRRLGATPEATIPFRQPYKWRKRHRRLTARLTGLTDIHYASLRKWLERNNIG